MSPVPENLSESFDQSLRRMAAILPNASPPEALRARVLGSLPVPAPPQPKPSRLRLAAAGLAACAVAAVLVTGPHSGLRPASAAEVRAAILRANTWHFVGWHLKDGRRVRWEVWGRRSPALYREQVGDEVYLDDGTHSTHILPPEPKNGRVHGVVLILPSRPLPGQAVGNGDRGANFLVGIGGDAAGFSPRGSGGSTETFEAKTGYGGDPAHIKETATLTVDRSTHLPMRYVVRRVESLPEQRPGVGLDARVLIKLREYTQAELTPTYDVPLPDAVAEIRSPAGYVVTDAGDAPPTLSAPAGSVATQGGLTVRAKVVAQDAEGDLHLRFYAWVGKEPLNSADTGLQLDGLMTPGRYGTDDRGNAYIQIHDPGPTGVDDGGADLWLVPAEPLAPNAPPPAGLDLAATLGISRYERIGRTGRFVPITTGRMTFHLSLPTGKEAVGYDAVIANVGRYGMKYVGMFPSLAHEAAEQRAMDCYNRPTLFVGGKAVRRAGFGPNYERAAYWWGAAAEAAEHTGDARQAESDRQQMAVMQRLERQGVP